MAMATDHDVTVIIPALNEERAIEYVLSAVPPWVSRVVVVDNGSTDRTAEVAAACGATVVHEPRRGYGAACLAGLATLDAKDIVVFLSGDHSDDPSEMDRLVDPIRRDEVDLVIGSRVLGNAEPGSLSLPQRVGNVLASTLLSRIWRVTCTDLGPFRAIGVRTWSRLVMGDLGYGWTVQMQARAAGMGLRVMEIPVRYRRRIAGKSKISGTVRGTVGAGVKILGTLAREAWVDRRSRGSHQRLVVFSRYPEAGTTKTRLIPALGAEGAADLQRGMTRHVLDGARRWADGSNEVEVRFAGGDHALMARTFGRDMHYVEQGNGTLGERLARAADDAFREGCKQIVIIGCDCPGIDAGLLWQAFARLRTRDLVLGPATDGGYYLIGLRRPAPGVFDGIDWGTGDVLRQTQERVRRTGLTAAWLPMRSDVDEPADLEVWHQVRRGDGRSEGAARFSIIIPTLNEAPNLPATLRSIGQARDVEVIVVDGGSTDNTIETARRLGARVTEAPRGRASQMNAGAAASRGDILLFLHADTRLPVGWADQVAAILATRHTVAGAFRLAFDTAGPTLGLIEHAANLRSGRLGLPYGDQAVFVRRAVFDDLGGYRDLPVMEDYDLVRRLRRRGRIAIAPLAVITSARRSLHAGVLRTTLMHQLMILGWHVGVSPARLARWRDRPVPSPS